MPTHGKDPDTMYTLYNSISVTGTGPAQGDAETKIHELMSLVRSVTGKIDQEDPLISNVYLLAARHNMNRGAVVKAADICLERLQSFPEDDEVRFYYGHCLTRLHRFEEAGNVLCELDGRKSHPSMDTHVPGLYTFRKHTALGELCQRGNKIEDAEKYFKCALQSCQEWIPAQIGLIELEIVKTNVSTAHRNLTSAIQEYGSDPQLLLTAANLALISLKFEAADNIAASLRGTLLGDDRYEYLLFQLDFFRGDSSSLMQVPYLMTGEAVETEAARVWVQNLKGNPSHNDPDRIPIDAWQDEYDALERAWHEING